MLKKIDGQVVDMLVKVDVIKSINENKVLVN